MVVEDEREKLQRIDLRRNERQDYRRQSFQMENVFANMQTNKQNVLRVLLKADVQGSCEAITDALLKIENSEVRVEVVGDGVGAITESDVNLALPSCYCAGFNVERGLL